MFQDLGNKFARVFKELRGHGKVRESHIQAAMKEVRRALLEADVNYKVVKEFVGRVGERAVGRKVLDSLTPDQQVIKIVNEELVVLLGSTPAGFNIEADDVEVVPPKKCCDLGSGVTEKELKTMFNRTEVENKC